MSLMARIGRQLGLAVKVPQPVSRPVPQLVSRPQLVPIDAEKERMTKLIKGVEGTIYNFAKRYAQSSEMLADLIQEGRLGAMRAVQKWRKDGGANFNSYATQWIRAYIFRWLKVHNSIVIHDTNRSRPDTVRDVSLNAFVHGDHGETEWIELLEDTNAAPLDNLVLGAYHDADVRLKLGRIRARLGAIGWDIVRYRMLDNTMTLDEVGQLHGVSRERVRQIEIKTKQLLQRYLGEFAPGNEDGEGTPYENSRRL